MKPRDENKINEIYKATLNLVKANGLSGITMQMVAKEAGIATGTLYIYFKNKEALINALFDVCTRSSASTFFSNYDPEQPFKIGFHTIWLNIVQRRVAHFNESIFIEQCFHSPFIDEESKNRLRKMFEPMLQLIERGKTERLIKNMDTVWLLAFMIGSINEIAKRTIYYNIKLTDEILEANFQLCWDGIKA
ncbi:MAG: TetR/AcrR family transcriptional regulator [Niastella sp.]|uniref:TetR/AcrR family transcriptional regulator n=1 Tax=Niastella sp. TaxID=1869183 RepID=UPI00389AE84F